MVSFDFLFQGRLRHNVPLKPLTWMHVGGMAEILFVPQSIEALQHFMKYKPLDMSHFVMGAASNILIRDGGIRGVTLRLNKACAQIHRLENNASMIYVGSAVLNATLMQWCQVNACGGLEFLATIPGSLGGGVRMNAGCYQHEMANVLRCVDVMDVGGNIHRWYKDDLNFQYRTCALPEGWIVLGAELSVYSDASNNIIERIEKFQAQREASQPVRVKTGGSTFKNIIGGAKAWELIDQSGCRNWCEGDACISLQHANFMVNEGNASAQDFETLGERIQQHVLQQTGTLLEWEIHRIGYY